MTIQGYVGDTVHISLDVRRMLEMMDDIDIRVFTPRGGERIVLPQAQHLTIPGHTIVTVASSGLQQDAGNHPAARTRVDDLWQAEWPEALRMNRPTGEPSQAGHPGDQTLVHACT